MASIAGLLLDIAGPLLAMLGLLVSAGVVVEEEVVVVVVLGAASSWRWQPVPNTPAASAKASEQMVMRFMGVSRGRVAGGTALPLPAQRKVLR